MGLEKGDRKVKISSVRKITRLFTEINQELQFTGMQLCINTEYAPEYLRQSADRYAEMYQLDVEQFVKGRGHHKTIQQRHYEKMTEYAAKLEEYVEKIRICGQERNSYSKSDKTYTNLTTN